MSFYIQDLGSNFHSLLGFQHGKGSSIKAIIPLSATFPLVIGLNFLFCNSIVKSKVSHTWIIFPQSWRSLPTKPVFERILTKGFCQYILNLMSKKKLVSFSLDWINGYFQSFIRLPPHDMNIFWPASLSKFLWRFWTEFSQSWNNLRKTLWSHENLRSLTDLSGANIGFHSNSRDWLFWVFMMSKINPLMNKSALFW